MLSLYFLIQGVELWSREKLAESDSETITYHFDGDELWVLALSIKDVFDAGGRKCRNRSQFVDADLVLTAQLEKPVSDSGNCIHKSCLLIGFIPIG